MKFDFRIVADCDGPVNGEKLRQRLQAAIDAYRMEGELSADDDGGCVTAVAVEHSVNLNIFGMGAAEFKLLSQLCQWAYEIPEGSADSNLSTVLGDRDYEAEPLEHAYDALLNLSAAGQVGQQMAEGEPAAVIVRGESGNDMVLAHSPAWIDVPGWGTVGIQTNRGQGLRVSHWWGDSTAADPAREIYIPAVPDPANLRFYRYGDNGGHITLAQIREMQQQGCIFIARAEDSGVEGIYVEVAILSTSGQWERFCFKKLFGGSDIMHDGDLSNYSAEDAAALMVEMIMNGGYDVSIIHGLPTYSGDRAQADQPTDQTQGKKD